MGRLFEIREFCLQDGPGPRTTVFLQGCPLRCTWCQNPEGQVMVGGRCMSVEKVVDEIRRNEDFLRMSGGGVTFSGGEPLMQADFILKIINALPELNFAIETSGAVSLVDYRRVVSRMDLVLQDVKFADTANYRKWTGSSAIDVFENFRWLKDSGIPFIVRVPMIPGVNDSRKIKLGIAELLKGSQGLVRVELLPYNRLAGAKYAKLNRVYDPGFDESVEPDLDGGPFTENGFECVTIERRKL